LWEQTKMMTKKYAIATGRPDRAGGFGYNAAPELE
jgi:hypothetical protein